MVIIDDKGKNSPSVDIYNCLINSVRNMFRYPMRLMFDKKMGRFYKYIQYVITFMQM